MSVANNFSRFHEIKTLAHDVVELLHNTGNTRATQGKTLTITDIPTWIRNRLHQNEVPKVLDMMQARLERKLRKEEANAVPTNLPF
jgi:hypothetical protein